MEQYANIEEKLADLSSGKVSCADNVDFFFSNIEKGKGMNIFLEVNKGAKKRAEELDLKLKNGEKVGKLFGLCFAIKSNISVKGLNISCASKTLENYKGTFNADVIEKIESEDAIIVGIVNNDEFASGSSGENSAYGPTINPSSQNRIPGGSSSGSAAAVAAQMCDMSLGSDTGGSIRNPASHCGVVGIKPSYGRVSRYGLVDLSMSFDQIGPLSRDIFGSALALSVISGKSENDATTIERDVIDYSSQKPDRKYRIGVIKSFKGLVGDKRIQEVIDKKAELLKREGHEICEVDVANVDLAIQTYYPIVYTEFHSGTRKFDGVKYGSMIEQSCGEEVLRRILGGKEISRSEYEGAYYKKALRVKEIVEEDFARVFKDVDFIISPVTPILPHKFGTTLSANEMYAYDAFTIPANLAGICAGVIPGDKLLDDGDEVHVGIQVLANKFEEDTLFKGLNLISSLR